MNKPHFMMFLVVWVLLNSCWERQKIVVAPPEHPTYTLSGTVSHSGTTLPVIGAEVSATMMELYQGSFLDSMGCVTNSDGYYEINQLFRGRYSFLIKAGMDTLFITEIGMINYADKVLNVVILPPDSSHGNGSSIIFDLHERVKT